jgi:hypothetical protein
MPEQSVPGGAGPEGGKERFDAESARRILQRAAAEQQRLNNELADSYSAEELESRPRRSVPRLRHIGAIPGPPRSEHRRRRMSGRDAGCRGCGG